MNKEPDDIEITALTHALHMPVHVLHLVDNQKFVEKKHPGWINGFLHILNTSGHYDTLYE
jgi:hypothetical protein